MKKCNCNCKLIAVIAAVVAVIGGVIAVLCYIKRRRELYEADYYQYFEEFPDDEAEPADTADEQTPADEETEL